MDILHYVQQRELPCAVHAEGRSLFVSYDQGKREVTISTPAGVRIDSVQTDPVAALLLDADQSVLLMLLEDGSVRALDLDEKGRTRTPMFNQAYAMRQQAGSGCLALSEDRSLLVVGAGKRIQFFQIRPGKSPRPLQEFTLQSPAKSMRFTDGGKTLRVITETSIVVLADNGD